MPVNPNDIDAIEKAYLESLLQKQEYQDPYQKAAKSFQAPGVLNKIAGILELANSSLGHSFMASQQPDMYGKQAWLGSAMNRSATEEQAKQTAALKNTSNIEALGKYIPTLKTEKRESEKFEEEKRKSGISEKQETEKIAIDKRKAEAQEKLNAMIEPLKVLDLQLSVAQKQNAPIEEQKKLIEDKRKIYLDMFKNNKEEMAKIMAATPEQIMAIKAEDVSGTGSFPILGKFLKPGGINIPTNKPKYTITPIKG